MSLPDYLSDDQKPALKKVLEHISNGARETVLVGVAGSGKTTLTHEIVELCGVRTVLGAPTGRAAVVLREKSGREARTIHRLLYGGASYDTVRKKLSFHNPGPPCQSGELLIIDEASMVGTRLYRDVMNHLLTRAQILWIADKEQLPPVNDTWGPDLDHPTAALTKVHRQAEKSQIIRYATAIREGRGDAWESSEYDASDPNLQVYDGIKNAVDWLVDARERDEDATLITYTHKIRQEINLEVRSRLGLITKDWHFTAGDKVVVRSNNNSLGLMNGEVVTISAVSKGDFRNDEIYVVELEELPGTELRIIPEHIEAKPEVFQEWRSTCGLPREVKDLFIHVHYGQCITVHSSQGSQWKKVGFISDASYRNMKRKDPDMARRFAYTAVTRPSEALAIFME